MATNRITTPGAETTTRQHSRQHLFSGLAVRILIALAVSWLIAMAFFVTSVASH